MMRLNLTMKKTTTSMTSRMMRT